MVHRDDYAALEQSLDQERKRTNGRWSADQIRLNELEAKELHRAIEENAKLPDTPTAACAGLPPQEVAVRFGTNATGTTPLPPAELRIHRAPDPINGHGGMEEDWVPRADYEKLRNAKPQYWHVTVPNAPDREGGEFITLTAIYRGTKQQVIERLARDIVDIEPATVIRCDVPEKGGAR